MDEDRQELARRLFVTMTEMLESAHETAIAGQAAGQSDCDYAGAAHQLGALARNITVMADAVIVIATAADGDPQHGIKKLPQ